MKLLLPLIANFSSTSAEGGFLGTVGAEADGVNYSICREECRPQAGTTPTRLYIFVFIFFFIFYLYTLYILECCGEIAKSPTFYIYRIYIILILFLVTKLPDYPSKNYLILG